MINYDFLCRNCKHQQTGLVKYDERELPQTCEECGEPTAFRAFLTAPNIRTAKTSASFLDKTTAGGGRPASEGIEELKKANELEMKAMKLNPNSEEYKATKKEAAERLKLK